MRKRTKQDLLDEIKAINPNTTARISWKRDRLVKQIDIEVSAKQEAAHNAAMQHERAEHKAALEALLDEPRKRKDRTALGRYMHTASHAILHWISLVQSRIHDFDAAKVHARRVSKLLSAIGAPLADGTEVSFADLKSEVQLLVHLIEAIDFPNEEPPC